MGRRRLSGSNGSVCVSLSNSEVCTHIQTSIRVYANIERPTAHTRAFALLISWCNVFDWHVYATHVIELFDYMLTFTISLCRMNIVEEGMKAHFLYLCMIVGQQNEKDWGLVLQNKSRATIETSFFRWDIEKKKLPTIFTWISCDLDNTIFVQFRIGVRCVHCRKSVCMYLWAYMSVCTIAKSLSSHHWTVCGGIEEIRCAHIMQSIFWRNIFNGRAADSIAAVYVSSWTCRWCRFNKRNTESSKK